METEIVVTTDSMATTAQDTSATADDDNAAYTTAQLVALGCLAGVVCLITIGGNAVVLLSFLLQRSLRQPTNYFIASLAVSDLIIGCVSMPFYTVYLLAGQHWPLGEVLCDLWLSVDYTVCLCSIYTVLCITVDRFCSVRIPTRYRTWRTEAKVKVAIGVVWVVPAAVFFTTIFGWQHMVEGGRTVPPGKCYVQYMESKVFNAVLQIGYFWVTLVVMCVLYVAIYRTALQLQTKGSSSRRQVGGESAAETQQTTEAESGECKGTEGATTATTRPPAVTTATDNSGQPPTTTTDHRPVTSSSEEKDEKLSPSFSSEADQEEGHCGLQLTPAASAAPAAASDDDKAQERKRKRRRRGDRRDWRARKALRTITLILGAFIFCWTPWHLLSLMIGFCPHCVCLVLYDISYWLCYLNSPINPFCYAFANIEFKKTFVRIVKMDWRRL